MTELIGGLVTPGEPVLGQLERIDPRSVWQHEAHHFTPWLKANEKRLADALGILIEITEAEHPVGAFALDLVGTDLTHDKPLIIENQLTASDHSHLGQLITYAAGTGGATIVWIATSIRDEHRHALTWLNEQTDVRIHFFGVELEVVRIGDSIPAPLFNVVVMPNDWQKSVKAAAASATGGKGALYAEFWGQFIERIKAERPAWSKAKTGPSQSWFPMPSGITGCLIIASFAAGGKLRHELYIDRSTAEECKSLFDAIAAQSSVLEAAYGAQLTWERLDHRKASRITVYGEGDVAIVDQHDSYMNFFVDAGDRLRRALAAIEVD